MHACHTHTLNDPWIFPCIALEYTSATILVSVLYVYVGVYKHYVALYLFEGIHFGVEVRYIEHSVSCVQPQLVNGGHPVPQRATDHQCL